MASRPITESHVSQIFPLVLQRIELGANPDVVNDVILFEKVILDELLFFPVVDGDHLRVGVGLLAELFRVIVRLQSRLVDDGEAFLIFEWLPIATRRAGV